MAADDIFDKAMPRTYIRKRVPVDKESLKKAQDEVLAGRMTANFASKHFSVPKTTLLSRLKNSSSRNVRAIKVGRPTALSNDDEKYIVLAIQYCSDLGWPIGKEQVLDMVEQYVRNQKLHTPFKNNRPGEDWYLSFRKRYKAEISLRKPETVTSARAKGLSQETVNKFFDLLEAKLESAGVKNQPSRIYNLDETGLNTDPKLHKLLCRRGVKDAQAILPTEGKAMYTVLFCGNAAGEYLPPYVIYKAKNIYSSWLTGGPPGTVYNVTASGWMEDYVFESWLIDKFIPAVQSKMKPVVLIFDGHNSHLTYKSVVAAKEAEIIIICLPPHTSGALQPLDVSVFKSVKHVWRGILKEFFWESKHTSVKKEHFPLLLNDLFKYMVKHGGHLTNGFSKAGLCPLDRNVIPKEKIILSETLIDESALETTVNSSTDANIGNPPEDDRSEPSKSSNADNTLETQSPVIGSPACSSTPNTKTTTSMIAKSPMTPRSALRKAMVETLRPNPSTRTADALKQGRSKRKRVQKVAGECMTEDLCIQRLKVEEEERIRKKKEAKKKTEAKKKPATGSKAVITVGKKKKWNKTSRKRPKRKVIIESSSEEDLENFDVESEPDQSPAEDQDGIATRESVNVETEDISADVVVELTVGNYYIVKVEEEPSLLYAIGKLVSIRDDEFVVIQFYKSEPLTNKLVFRCWGEPESTPFEKVFKNLAKPSEFGKGGKLIYKENVLPDLNLK